MAQSQACAVQQRIPPWAVGAPRLPLDLHMEPALPRDPAKRTRFFARQLRKVRTHTNSVQGSRQTASVDTVDFTRACPFRLRRGQTITL